jgi:hypothetical protein
MPLTRLQLKNHLESARGLTRGREDGLVSDALIHEAIEEAIITVGIDCGLLPAAYEFSLRVNQWQYPMPEDMFELRSLWYIDSNGTRLPVGIIDQESFLVGRDPDDDLSTQPSFAAYPIYYSRILEPFALARPLHDFTRTSHITEGHIRTVEDSAINLGRTRDGTRMSPGDVVRNITTNAFGYIEVLDLIASLTNGTAQAGTNSTTLVAAAPFPGTIAEDMIICTPSVGVVTSYASVTEISGANITYEDMRGAATAFAAGDTYKIGIAKRIRLTTDAPHRGLREGSSATFNKGAATATMNATVFTDTRCTGSSPAGASVGEIAIAAGGSHGEITEVGTDYIVVTEWIGGNPVDGEVVTIQSCDEYQVETRPHIEPTIYIGPTPSSSDANGVRSMLALYIKKPFIPTQDWQFIDIPDKYRMALYKCVDWQCHVLAGNKNVTELAKYEEVYDREALKFAGDIDRGPKGEIMTVMGNRGGRPVERPYTTRSGVTYDVSNLLN